MTSTAGMSKRRHGGRRDCSFWQGASGRTGSKAVAARGRSSGQGEGQGKGAASPSGHSQRALSLRVLTHWREISAPVNQSAGVTRKVGPDGGAHCAKPVWRVGRGS